MYQLLVEAHLGQVLLEDLAVHVHALLPNIVVPVDLRIHALSPCAQSPITELRHLNKQGLVNSMQTACCHCAQDHRMHCFDTSTVLCAPASRNTHLGLF